MARNRSTITDIGTDNPPHPGALIKSMRSIGYTPPTALADLIDNSITAGAKNIRIAISPGSQVARGYVVVEDDGKGMLPGRLAEAMRWGGDGSDEHRGSGDLGRFGLGMKTASISMGLQLTVASRATGGPLCTLRWDLGHVAKAGSWKMLEGPAPDAEPLLARSALMTNKNTTGTIVIVTQLDRLAVHSASAAHTGRNEASLTSKVAAHLGMVFHRFLEGGMKIRFGEADIVAWNPFEKSELKASEMLGGGVEVSSYVLPHHSKTTDEDNHRMAGPSGWGAHQGFLVYRGKRLIMPGGWFRLFLPSDSCRLARIRIDLPNTLDDSWKLSVMKSSVVPPSGQVADLERIGQATRRQAMAVYNFRGERQAPSGAGDNDPVRQAFWKQVPTSAAVHFRINRAHPVVQTLKQSVRDPAIAEEFLRAFERMLPLDAILQDPARTTIGAADPIAADQFDGLVDFARKVLKLLRSQGFSADLSRSIVLSSEPFALNAEKLGPHLK
jgi:hypothetical protein